jgi:GntR family transcriptional regulator
MVEEPASPKVRQQLELPSDARVLHIERLRLGNGEPVGIHICYLPVPPEGTLTQEELERAGSLYALLESKFNLDPTEADETLEATVANEREAQLLEIEVGSPLLLIERITLSSERRPMELVKMLYRADRYKYYTHLRRNAPGPT